MEWANQTAPRTPLPTFLLPRYLSWLKPTLQNNSVPSFPPKDGPSSTTTTVPPVVMKACLQRASDQELPNGHFPELPPFGWTLKDDVKVRILDLTLSK
ncbi:hypothetical protein TorRG33x02_125280 [Trema orientale]|uniref:Uncharacterized protein n=1 Tax=Trema orientale TaxID=63057 RepID=A0A2P5F1N0_TREOI|nr:hypothetical protein TorRG33x02_125280 [Trema orientale]